MNSVEGYVSRDVVVIIQFKVFINVGLSVEQTGNSLQHKRSARLDGITSLQSPSYSALLQTV